MTAKLEFSGNDSYVALGSPNSLHIDTNQPFTVEGCMYLHAFNAEQIGKTFQATGSTNNWTWEFYGLRVRSAGEVEYLVGSGGGAGGGRSSPHMPAEGA